MGRLRASLTPVLAALAVLAMLWVVLPLPAPTAGGQASLAGCATMANQQSSDVAGLERCHALIPTDIELSADLAAAYTANARPDDAIALYQEILTLDPSYAEVHVRLARLLQSKGDRAAALDHVDQALRIQPNRKLLIDFRSELAR
jgi:tetratricopeptide (TPR) repeat protein